MKTKISSLNVLLLILLINNTVNAQFNTGINPDGRTASPYRSIGIGFFTTTNRPLSALHVNSWLLPGSPNFGAGELFRTDGDQTLTNAWRMFSGTSATAQTERFALYTGNGTTGGAIQDANFRATTGNLHLRANNNMIFYTNNCSDERVTITCEGKMLINDLKNESLKIVCADKSGTLVLNDALQTIVLLEKQVTALQAKVNELEKLLAVRN